MIMPENQNYKVLIAEDDSIVADVISRKLVKKGFHTILADDGQKALDELKKNHFDLILLDLTMPVLDGFQVLSALKESKNTIPVLVMSNLSQPEDKTKAKDLGAWNYIIKSGVTAKDIVEKVEQCIIEHKC
jgi:CheY-like chemotaxis protein